jgi:outer membrane biosynthesis protein TonB
MSTLEMSGFNRTYQPPRGLRGLVLEGSTGISTDNLTAWDLLRLQGSEKVGPWAKTTLDTVLASIDTELADKRGCQECDDTGFYGVADADNPDLLVGMLRRVGAGEYESLAADGSWSASAVAGPIEILALDVASDLADAITEGAAGLLRKYAMPRAFLPPSDVVTASLASEVLSAGEDDSPQSEWVNYAVVDDDDPGAVWTLVRASGANAETLVGDTWVAGPVPDDWHLVRLGDDQASLVSAALLSDLGSPDPRAERLRRYWSSGKGAAKIRWNTPSDWRRCYRQLRKYMGLRARGYCARLHRRNTGMWPGDRRNRGLLSAGPSIENAVRLPSGHVLRVGDNFQVQGLEAAAYPAKVIDFQTFRERAFPDLDGKTVNVPVDSWADSDDAVVVLLDCSRPQPVRTESSRPVRPDLSEVQQSLLDRPTVAADDSSFRIGEVLAPSGVEVLRAHGGLTCGLTAAIHTALRDYTRRAKRSPSEGIAIFLPTTVVRLAEPTSDSRATRAIIDTAHEHSNYNTPSPEENLLAAVQAGAITAERTTEMADTDTLTDGVYTEVVDNSELLRSMVAGAFPVQPPDEWYQDPELDGPTPLTVADDGRVYGHIATFDVAHIGLPGRTKAPKSPSNYAYFRTGELVTASGKKVNVGQLTLAGGHASMHADAARAVEHYDNTGSAVADVTAGEDRYGVWVAGSLRPSVTAEQVRVLRASAPSGDWRTINGRLELVAVCQVNVPGFPVARQMVAGGAITALVAAGARPLALARASLLADAAVLERVSALEGLVAELHSDGEVSVRNAEDVDTVTVTDANGEVVAVALDDEPPVVAATVVEDTPVVEAKTEAEPEEQPEPTPEPEAEPETPNPAAEPEEKPVVREPEEPVKEDEPAKDENAEKLAAARKLAVDLKRDLLRKRIHKAPEPEQVAADGAAKGERKGIGGYPINNKADLRNAIFAFGRAKPEDKARTKAHIISRAKALGLTFMLPDKWVAS